MTIIDRIEQASASGTIDPSLAAAATAELRDLKGRVDALEELLIVLVRTGWPWDEEGEPNDIHRVCRDGYTSAIREARAFLGLGQRSVLTRTEPKT